MMMTSLDFLFQSLSFSSVAGDASNCFVIGKPHTVFLNAVIFRIFF